MQQISFGVHHVTSLNLRQNSIHHYFACTCSSGHELLFPLIPTGPAPQLPPRRRDPQVEARVDAKELPDLLRRIKVYQGTHVTRLAMKLLALTFVRTSELIEAKWSEFDLQGARWDIPAERMEMRTPHIVSLAK
jgi:integrase